MDFGSTFSTTPPNGCFQKSLPGIWNFLPRFFKVIYHKCFSLKDKHLWQRHSASWHPAISSSVFSLLFDFAIFTPPNLNFFFYFCIFWSLLCILFWKFTASSYPVFLIVKKWIANSVLNRGKSAIPPLFNGLKVLSSASDQAKLFP